MQWLLSMLAVAALALSSLGLGGRLLRALAFDSHAERIAVASAVGAGLIGTIAFGVGLVGLLYAPLVIGALGVAVFLSRRELRALRLPPLMFVLLLGALLIALRPPTTLDATLYHLGYVRHYALHHRVEPVPNLRFPVFPQLNELLFTVGFLAGGEPAPALVELWLGAIAALALYAWGRRVASHEAGLVAAALWLGNPIVQYLAATPYVDVGLTAFVVVAALAVFRSDDWLGVAGLCAGFAAGTKYLGLLPMAIFGLMVLRRRPIFYSLFAVFAAAPFYLYNYFHTGNPIVFGVHWSALDQATYSEYNRAFGAGRGPLALLILPWNLTFSAGRFAPEEPFLPLVLPALLLIVVRRRALALLGIVAAYTLVWFYGVQVARYLLPVSGLFCLATALSLPRPRAWMAALLLVPGALYSGAWLVREGFAVDREAYLSRQVPGHRAVQRLNRSLGTRYHLYGLTYERLHYFADGELLGDWFGPGRYSDVFAKIYDAPALHAHLKKLGADHYLVACPGPHLPPEISSRDSFIVRFEPVLAEGGDCLFRLR